jgi:hypothetical protein
MKKTFINTPEGRMQITFSKAKEDIKVPPRWARRVGLIIFSPIAFCFYLSVISDPKQNLSFSMMDFLKGMKALWNLK